MGEEIRKDIKLFLLLLIVFCFMSVCCFGCSGENDKYKTYEMKADDVRLRWCNHPLFSFEYPEEFILADVNENPHGGVYSDRSEVGFGYYEKDLSYRYLHVTIYQPSDFNWDNASDFVENIISGPSIFGDIPIIKKVTVDGREAHYLEGCEKPLGSEEQMIYRLAVFDYAGMIWKIRMDTYSAFPEPSYVQESFDHILSSFKILDANCDEQSIDDDLNITVTYENEGFYITNNGDVALCEIELFADYANDDLSTGYHYDRIVGILPNQTRKIHNYLFENTSGNQYTYYPWNGPSKLLVQAEFAGCKNKVYTHIQTWD